MKSPFFKSFHYRKSNSLYPCIIFLKLSHKHTFYPVRTLPLPSAQSTLSVCQGRGGMLNFPTSTYFQKAMRCNLFVIHLDLKHLLRFSLAVLVLANVTWKMLRLLLLSKVLHARARADFSKCLQSGHRSKKNTVSWISASNKNNFGVFTEG